MTGDELKAWRTMMKMSQRQASDVLGYDRRQYIKMERGLVDIRACVDLACAAYALGLRCYDGPTIQAMRERKQERKGNR